jgi:hypothetical protein
MNLAKTEANSTRLESAIEGGGWIRRASARSRERKHETDSRHPKPTQILTHKF